MLAIAKLKCKNGVRTVDLTGFDDEIRLLLKRRQEDVHCTQRPRENEKLPEEHRLHVRYLQRDTGDIDILEVHIQLGKSLICCYEADEREGAVNYENSDRRSYYLSRRQLEGIEEVVGEHENECAANRLALKGPNALPRTRRGRQ